MKSLINFFATVRRINWEFLLISVVFPLGTVGLTGIYGLICGYVQLVDNYQGAAQTLFMGGFLFVLSVLIPVIVISTDPSELLKKQKA